MEVLFYVSYGIWGLASLLLFVYICQELLLLMAALRGRKQVLPSPPVEWPMVTIQLPVYNEKYVVKRLIDAVCAFDYPTDKMEIQVLDDSNDETVAMIAERVEWYRKEGFNIQHIQRGSRVGYKAGALDHGQQICAGQFIAIFDADFLPAPDFLQKTIPHFASEEVGVVQTRWSHINEDYSILTRAEAVMLNLHFFLEQGGRSGSSAFINFNGTGGVWRKSCIEDAGGWHMDTLTEDLDLSFRAQMKGWRFVYLRNEEAPSELPITMDAFKTQQFRWSKGAAECVRMNMRALWQSSVSTWAKTIGSFHLLNSSIYFVVLCMILINPVLLFLNREGQFQAWGASFIVPLNLFVITAIPLVFLFCHLLVSRGGFLRRLAFIPAVYFLMCMSLGISLYMVKGILEGYRGKTSGFIRTPKYAVDSKRRLQIKTRYFQKKEGNMQLAEAVLFIYGFVIMAMGWQLGAWLVINYGLMIAIGFGVKLFLPHYDFRGPFKTV